MSDPIAMYLQRHGGTAAPPSAPAAPTSTAATADDPVSVYLRQHGSAPDDESFGTRLGHNTRDVVRSLAQGAFGGLGAFSDEAEAKVTGRPVEQIRGEMHDFQSAHQFLEPTLEVLGAMGTGEIPGLGRAPLEATATPGARIMRGARTGLASGAIYGAGKSEGDLGERLKAGAWGAALGAGGATALGGLTETLGGLARSYQVGPKALDALAAIAPKWLGADRLAREAQALRDAAADRTVISRAAQGGRTPATMAAAARAAHPDLPVAVADLGGENTQQALGAMKRLPGPSKEAATSTLETRQGNLYPLMQESLERNAPEASAALGLPAGTFDTRTAHPDEFLAAARKELGDRFAPRYDAMLNGPFVGTPALQADADRLLTRPSVREHGLGFGERIAGEADGTLGDLDAPTPQQLHTIRQGLGRHKMDVEDRITAAASQGDPARGLRTDLRGIQGTYGALTDLIDALTPGYRRLSQDYAGEVAPIDAFTRGTKINPLTPNRHVQTAVADLGGNANAATALGGGYGRKLVDDVQRAAGTNSNPARAVVGTGNPVAVQVQNLRTAMPQGAPAIEADADVIGNMFDTGRKVLGGSQTAERTTEDAAAGRLARAAHAIVHSRPLTALDALMNAEYGPGAKAVTDRLLLGAQPGQRQQLLDYLDGFGQPSALRALRYASRRMSTPGLVGGLAGGSLASGR